MDIAEAGAHDPEQVQGSGVSAGFFSTLRVQPLLGRVFHPGEDQATSPPEVILSESLWRRRFGASPAVLGQTISVAGSRSTIVGVMPSSFGFPRENTELWINLQLAPPTRRGPFLYRGIARLKPGVTLEQAQADTNAIGRRIMREHPYYKNLTLPVVGLREALVGSVKTPLLVLIGAVALVLLIAVGNVANLMLARATVREREMALRLSLGAGRSRLIRQLLTESVVLAVVGGVAGLGLAYGGIQLLRAWNPGNLPLIAFVHLDSRALAFMLLVSSLTGVLFGLAPALQNSRADLNSTLKEAGRGSAGATRRRMRAGLVVAEIALSLMLLVGAGLLLRSLALLQRVTGGFTAPPEQLLTMEISSTDRKYREAPALRAYYDQVVERARHLPGVESAAVSDTLPPNRQSDADIFTIPGQVLGPNETNPAVSDAVVGPGYFETLGIPLRAGRYFTEFDTEHSAPVVIISESMARRFFPDGAIGHRLKQSGPTNNAPYMQIAGVVADVKYTGLERDTDMAYYMPYQQNYSRPIFLVVRSTVAAATLASMLRREIQAIDRTVTLSAVSTMQQALDSDFAQPRFNTMLLLLFAGVALLLAMVGIYGVTAYSVAQRYTEIGIRMALGAGRATVLNMMIREGAGLALIGIVLGLAGAFILTRLLSTLLFGVSATDPLTFAATSFGLLAVALLATFIPAQRATRISPIRALRYQ